jgi:7-carboxy-7-deazaguanine synthase
VLQICEIFYSLQGESSYSGLPCIFVRLAGCNLRCSWCDTSYSHAIGTEMSPEAILQQIQSYPARLVEFTGGEPLLQKAALLPLLETLHKAGYTILLETNGSVSLQGLPDYVTAIVDIKCPASEVWQNEAELKPWLENLARLRPQDELKFVLATREDYLFAVDFIQAHSLQAYHIIFSPIAERLAPTQLAAWLLEDGLPHRLQLQLHKLIDLK